MKRHEKNSLKSEMLRFGMQSAHRRKPCGKPLYNHIYKGRHVKSNLERATGAHAVGNTRKSAGKEETLEAICARWLDEVRHTVKESTYARYYRALTSYLLPRVGMMRVSDVCAATVRELAVELSQSGGIRGGGLSTKTVSDVISVLRCALRHAEENGCTVARIDCTLPIKRSRCRINILNERARQELEVTLGNEVGSVPFAILLSLFTGLRIGEICGLRWGDIDLDEGVLTVNRTVARIPDLTPEAHSRTKIVITEPKTAASARVIPLPGFLRDKLAIYKSYARLGMLSQYKWNGSAQRTISPGVPCRDDAAFAYSNGSPSESYTSANSAGEHELHPGKTAHGVGLQVDGHAPYDNRLCSTDQSRESNFPSAKGAASSLCIAHLRRANDAFGGRGAAPGVTPCAEENALKTLHGVGLTTKNATYDPSADRLCAPSLGIVKKMRENRESAMQRAASDRDCYVLTNSTDVCEPHRLYVAYKRIMTRHGLGHLGFHTLRHTFATRCIEAGFDAKSLSEILGHSNVSTTLAIYVHPTLSQKRAQMERLR